MSWPPFIEIEQGLSWGIRNWSQIESPLLEKTAAFLPGTEQAPIVGFFLSLRKLREYARPPLGVVGLRLVRCKSERCSIWAGSIWLQTKTAKITTSWDHEHDAEVCSNCGNRRVT